MNEQSTHYILADAQSRITDGWAAHQAPGRPTEGAILYSDKAGAGGFRLIIDGVPTEENPPLFDFRHMVPLYRWDGAQAIRRTPQEIEADRPEPGPPAPTAAGRLIDCEKAIALLIANLSDGEPIIPDDFPESLANAAESLQSLRR